MPFYGGETYGLHAIGQEAVSKLSVVLLLAAIVLRLGFSPFERTRTYLFASTD